MPKKLSASAQTALKYCLAQRSLLKKFLEEKSAIFQKKSMLLLPNVSDSSTDIFQHLKFFEALKNLGKQIHQKLTSAVKISSNAE